MQTTEKIRVGISSCLLGNNVRYDSSNRLDTFLRDILGRYIEWIPVCPEVEMGLGVPREAMRIIYHENPGRLMTVNTGIDYTEKILKYAEKKIKELKRLKLCGFVFKSRSPSCAFKDAKVYSKKGMPVSKSSGMFAELFMRANPLTPCEDEVRLKNQKIRENFFKRVVTMYRLMLLEKKGITREKLIKFHSSMKLLVMTHSPAHLTLIEKLISNLKGRNPEEIFDEYREKLMDAMILHATTRKTISVLYHIIGYFKNNLSREEKKELIESIEKYRQGLHPLIVPITLINHYLNKFRIALLKEQVFLNPSPVELRLFNY